MGISIGAGPGLLELLYANSGTNTATAETTVDSIAISGLTAKDTVLVYVTAEQITQAQTGALLLNYAPDDVDISNINRGATITAGMFIAAQILLRQNQSGSTSVSALLTGSSESSGTFVVKMENRNSTVTTAWTGSWTLGLRHEGQTSGGTFRFSWAVYKVLGQ